MKLPLINSPRALARATIDDDRCPPRRVPLWSPWRDGAEAKSPVHTEVTAFLDDRLSGKWTEPMAPEAIAVVVGMMICLVGARVAADALGFHWIAGYLLLSPGFLVVFTVAGWLALRRNARQIRTILLTHNHCASCGYALAAIPAAADGLTTCPECGAAWRLAPTATPPQAEGLDRK